MKYKLMIVLLLVLPFAIIAQEEEDYKVTISGFVSSENVYDSRQTVTAREGDVLLYPKRVVEDLNGEDINGQSSFNMFSIHSRLRANASGPEVFGAQSSALVEMDFVGTTNAVMSMVRLRHAIIKLDWEKNSLQFGQYWHPLFVTGSFPEVSSWGGGLPFAAFSRNPQVRYTHHVSDHFFGSITALMQRDFASPGPMGTSSVYLQNSSKPELDLHLEYHKNGWKLGTVFGYKELKPRLQNLNGQVENSTIGSAFGSLYLRKDWNNFTVKAKAIYGQNMYNFLMLGGYAEYANPITGQLTYSNYETGALWTELIYSKEKFIYSLFVGYTDNMGVMEEAKAGLEINRYARGADIDYAYRISPRLGYQVHKFLIMGECVFDAAAYGDVQENSEVTNTSLSKNTRIQLHLKYSF